MRLKLKNILAFVFLISPAQATVLINPPKPYPQFLINDTNIEIDYAGNSVGALTTGSISTSSQGYRMINTSTNTSSDRIYVDVYSNITFNVTTGKLIGVTLTNNSTNQLVELSGASVVSGNGAPTDCGSGNCFDDKKAAIYTAGTIIRLSFNLNKLCPTSSGSSFCSNYSTLSGDRLIETIKVNFGVVDNAFLSSNVALASGTGNADSATFTLGVSDLPPLMSQTSCPSDFYFPGDGEIIFDGGKFSATTNSGTTNSGSDLISYLVMANEGAVAPGAGGISSNSIVSTVTYGSLSTRVEGFTNTTNGSDYVYSLVVHAQNRAGIISDAAASASGASCNVQTQEIKGVLNESKCFIATAAFHDGHAKPVVMLRKFRDQVLSRFDLGRRFIQKYYFYSPALAEWSWNQPIVRAAALKALIPVQMVAWMILKASDAEEVQADTVDPYIKKLKKRLVESDQSTELTESYTETEKKKLLESEAESVKRDDSYIDRLKKNIGEQDTDEDTSKDYSNLEKNKLEEETDRESPIQVIKEGRDQQLGFGKVPSIKNAFGFKMGITPNMKVEIANGSNAFDDVYGKGYRPELIFHYERQWFHSENFGSLSLGGDIGVAYSGGNGLFQYNVGSSNQSKTGFSFFQVPVLIDAVYRFNLLRLIRPYAGAGAGAIFYNEVRNDSKIDKRGYTPVYKVNVGASLLLDFFDRKTSRNSYLSSGIQHSYFFLEYLYLNSFKSTVSFKRSGIYGGFLFEY